MLTRRNIAAGLGLSLMAEQAWARSTTPAPLLQQASLQTPPTTPPLPAPGVLPPASKEPPPVFLDTALDEIDRMTVEVFINGQGPFNFVVDTGADRSALSAPLAERLGLARGPDVMLHGVGGSALTPTAKVPLMVAGDSRMKDAELPVLPPERLGVDGLLGVDMLDNRNVIMDFRRKRLEVRRSTAAVGRLSRRAGGLGGRRRPFRSTGGRQRPGQRRALRGLHRLRIGRQHGQHGPGRGDQDAGAPQARARHGHPADRRGGEATLGELRVVRSIELGALRMTNLPLVLADLHIFDVWNLNIGRPCCWASTC
jgi:hypothetical protein